ncbi:alpha/beta fold hydrolase [Pseudorhodobacter ferrugineus]|uniref:alpha/beta fold hydrolase n=1 Tax=Pseudorhodobacter ferrugineus TaxID=77008 RepID=UPI0003B6D921|nr:alpha/beta fold hydrolase [Pseudorhodobacter ferrugineus]
MQTILLIHGSCHGAWCWRDTLPHLPDTRAIDLPGHGQDSTPIDQITLDLYVEAILDAITVPTVLVGHSMAGYPITAAALRAPEKIARLVYVCAYVPQSGQSLADMRRAGPSQPLLEAIETSADRKSFSFRPEMVADKLYHDCLPEVVRYAQAHLGPQAILPQSTPLFFDTVTVPKRYILCRDDRAIPPDYQATMSQGWDDVRHLNSSHSPFFSTPQALAKAIL